MKTYKSIYRNQILHIPVQGVSVRIKFEDEGRPYNCSYYNTDNEDIQKGIETHPVFGKSIFLYKEEKEEAQEERKFDKVYDSVKRTQDANKILVTEYGVDKDLLSTKSDALAFADKLNISFPNL